MKRIRADVWACGPSARSFSSRVRISFRVGVNDAARWCPHRLDALIVPDGPERFDEGRRVHITSQRCPTWVHQGDVEKWRDAGLRAPVLPIKTCGVDGSFLEENLDKPRLIPLYQTSAFAAAILSYRLGATEVGLIGVDLDDHPELKADLDGICFQFRRLRALLWDRGCELFCRTPDSALVRTGALPGPLPLGIVS